MQYDKILLLERNIAGDFMVKKDNKQLPDTPWHVGYTLKEEDDPRRHKAGCRYNLDGICKRTASGSFMLKCAGSAHCKFYSEKLKDAEQELKIQNHILNAVYEAKNEILNNKNIPESYFKCPSDCSYKRSDGRCTKLQAAKEKTYGADCKYYSSKYAKPEIVSQAKGKTKSCRYVASNGKCQQQKCYSYEKDCVKNAKVYKSGKKKGKYAQQARAAATYTNCKYYDPI